MQSTFTFPFPNGSVDLNPPWDANPFSTGVPIEIIDGAMVNTLSTIAVAATELSGETPNEPWDLQCTMSYAGSSGQEQNWAVFVIDSTGLLVMGLDISVHPGEGNAVVGFDAETPEGIEAGPHVTVPLNTPFTVTAKRRGDTVRVYYNGTLQSTNTLASPITFQDVWLAVETNVFQGTPSRPCFAMTELRFTPMATDTITINSDVSQVNAAALGVGGVFYISIQEDIAASGVNLGVVPGPSNVRFGCTSIAGVGEATDVSFPIKVYNDATGAGPFTLTADLLPTGSGTPIASVTIVIAEDETIDDSGGAARTVSFTGLSLSQSDLDGLEIRIRADDGSWYVGNVDDPTVTYSEPEATASPARLSLGLGLGL